MIVGVVVWLLPICVLNKRFVWLAGSGVAVLAICDIKAPTMDGEEPPHTSFTLRGAVH